MKTNAIELVFDFDDSPHERGFAPSAYTLSPDMMEIVYSVGRTFTAYLYRVQADGQIRQLVPLFFRAWLPAWSPDGATLAFMGNETHRGTPVDEIISYSQMRPILYLPWNLYLMDAENDTVRKIAEDFTDLGLSLSWLESRDSRSAKLVSQIVAEEVSMNAIDGFVEQGSVGLE